MKVWIFVTLEGGLKEDDFRATESKAEAEQWERTWLDRWEFKDADEYHEHAGGLDHNYYVEEIDVEGGPTTKEDKCPKCGASLDHGIYEVLDGMELVYPVECRECKWTGRQLYGTRFEGYIDNEGEEVTE